MALDYHDVKQLKAQMVFLGISQVEVAERSRVSRQMVSMVLAGRRKSWRVMASIRRLIDRKFKENAESVKGLQVNFSRNRR
ncbi:MAG: helix-turn-helix transcriptional regulator [Syntrophobacter sp.]